MDGDGKGEALEQLPKASPREAALAPAIERPVPATTQLLGPGENPFIGCQLLGRP